MNLTEFENKSEDYFANVFNDTGGYSRAFMMCSWAVVEFVGAPMYAGMISYKMNGSLTYRTLIDKLKAYLYLLYLGFAVTGFHLVCLRAFTVLPRGLCIANFVGIGSLGLTGCLTVLEIQFLRYLYTCVWSHVCALDDELFSRFFAVLNTGFGLSSALIMILTQSYQSWFVAVCEGVDPTNFQKSESQIHPMSLILFASVVIAIFINVIIHFKTKRLDPLHSQQVKTMFGLSKTVFAVLLVLLVLCLVPSIYLKRMIRLGRITEVPRLLFTMGYISTFIPALVLLPLAHYLQDANLRRHVSRIIGNCSLGLFVFRMVWKMGQNRRSSAVQPLAGN